MDFGDLKHDKSIQEKLKNFHNSINRMDTILEVAFAGSTTDNLTIKDQLNYDLFVAYMLNTLYWLYLRSKGLDPNEHDIKKENIRVKEYMMKARNAIERHTDRKTIDKSAAERFIRHAIRVPKNIKLEEEDNVEVKTEGTSVADSDEEVQILEDTSNKPIDLSDSEEDDDDDEVIIVGARKSGKKGNNLQGSAASPSGPPQKKRRIR